MNQDATRLKQIIFIPGGQIIANNTVGERLLPRLHMGLQLWKDTPYKLILVTGGITQPPNIQDESEASIMKKWLKEHGVPDKKIIEEGYAFDTFENARFGLTLLKRNHIEAITIDIVSEHLHTFRVTLSLRAFGFKGKIRRVPISISMNWKQLLTEGIAIIYYILDRKGTWWIAENKRAQRKKHADYFSLTS